MGPHCDDFTRGIIVGKAQEGKGPTQIAKEVKMATSTVADIIAKGDPRQKGTKRGPDPILTPAQERRLVKKIKQNPWISYDDLAEELEEEFDVEISGRSVNRYANKHGINSYAENHKGKLTDVLRVARYLYSVEWCFKDVSHWTGNGGKGNAIHFTMDGVAFGKAKDPQRCINAMKGFVKREKGEGLLPQHIIGNAKVRAETHKFISTYMVGGGNGRITLCERYHGKAGKMSAAIMLPIVGLLAEAIGKCWPGVSPPKGGGSPPKGGWMILQDNDTGQTATSLDPAYAAVPARNHRMPAGSGDLRFIESWWPKIRLRLYEGDPGPDESEADFHKRVRRTVLRTVAEDLTPHAESMPNRLKECIWKGGGRVRY